MMRPVQTTIMYGKPSQVLTIRIMLLARKGSENQAGLIPKSEWRMRLISPMLLLKSPLKTRIERKEGMA